jgi:Skp family chaperone for outer membrane proteins
MNQPRVALFGLLAGLVAATAFTSSTYAQKGPPGAPAATDSGPAGHIGIVDLRLVYTTIQETADSQHSLRGMQDALDLKQKQDAQDLKDMQDKITKDYKPGTDAHEKAMEDFDAKSLALQQDEQSQKIKMVRAQGKQLVSAYNEIKDKVAAMAKAKGLDLVLVKTGQDAPPNAMDIANPETLGNLIFGRNVLYSGDKVDLTQDLITALDADYKAGVKPAH